MKQSNNKEEETMPEWAFNDNLICIQNYINRYRRDYTLTYITAEEVSRLIKAFADDNNLPLFTASEQVKRIARNSGETELLSYIKLVSKRWKPVLNNSNKELYNTI